MEIENSPQIKDNKLVCEICNYYCSNKRDFILHNLTAKHIRNSNGTSPEIENSPYLNKKILCELCNYKCNKESEFKKHLNSLKHINKTNESIVNNNESEEIICVKCNKTYKTMSGLWKHKKICNLEILPENIVIQNVSENVVVQQDASNNDIIQVLLKENSDFKSMIIEMMKSNTDLQKQMLEVCQKIQPSTINNNNINANDNSKTFNLQVFLNEKCKDAMNLDDFANSIQLKLSDLIRVGEEGYIPGMSKVFIEWLGDTEICKRPIHCSDEKREAIQVKMADKWEREAINSEKLMNAVRIVEKKQFDMITTFRDTYPECMNSESHHNDMLIKLFQNLSNSREPEFIKVMKKVAKSVVINKDNA